VPFALVWAMIDPVDEETESWTCRHFSLANPRADGAEDLPRLLRRVADHVEAAGIKPMEILDLTFESEITEDGPWWSATVYWQHDVE
jgi:hypothetical protein